MINRLYKLFPTFGVFYKPKSINRQGDNIISYILKMKHHDHNFIQKKALYLSNAAN